MCSHKTPRHATGIDRGRIQYTHSRRAQWAGVSRTHRRVGQHGVQIPEPTMIVTADTGCGEQRPHRDAFESYLKGISLGGRLPACKPARREGVGGDAESGSMAK